jgi:hypothetical protein
MNFPEFLTHKNFIRVEKPNYLHKSSIIGEILMWVPIGTQGGPIGTKVKS